MPAVQAFAEKVLTRMADGVWLANFASESVKSSGANIAIATTATPSSATASGWVLNGEKSFGCATGIADTTWSPPRSPAPRTRTAWRSSWSRATPRASASGPSGTASGMRGSANHGVTLSDVFIPADEALTVPGAFVKMLQCSRGSFVGNQLAITAIYVGAAQASTTTTLDRLMSKKFADTGKSIAESPMHQVIIGDMTERLETAYLWLRRQLLLETSEPPIAPKDEVYRQWRMAKGSICEAAFDVAVGASRPPAPPAPPWTAASAARCATCRWAWS